MDFGVISFFQKYPNANREKQKLDKNGYFYILEVSLFFSICSSIPRENSQFKNTQKSSCPPYTSMS